MTFKNIMVPYDGSSCSNKAFKISLELAKKHRTSIRIVTCIQATQKIWLMDVGYDNSVFIKHKTAAKKDLLKLEVIAKNEGIKSSSTIIVAQSIVKPLLSFAKSRKIDLIVMGSHGRTGLDKLFLGSIANGVLNRAHCPVLIIR